MNRAMVVFMLSHLSAKDPMHVYSPSSISTHKFDYVTLCFHVHMVENLKAPIKIV